MLLRQPRRVWDLKRLKREVNGTIVKCWRDMSTTLTSLAAGADLLFTGMNFEGSAANVAELYDIPLVTLHYFPLRPNGQLLSFLPASWAAPRRRCLGGCRGDR